MTNTSNGFADYLNKELESSKKPVPTPTFSSESSVSKAPTSKPSPVLTQTNPDTSSFFNEDYVARRVKERNPENGIIKRSLKVGLETLKDIPSDIAEGIGSTFKNIQEGGENFGKGLHETFAEGKSGVRAFEGLTDATLGTIADIFGGIVTTTGKAFLAPEVEDELSRQMSNVMDTDRAKVIAEDVMNTWNQIPEDLRESLKVTGRLAEFIGDTIGGGIAIQEGKNLFKTVKKTMGNALDETIEKGKNTFKKGKNTFRKGKNTFKKEVTKASAEMVDQVEDVASRPAHKASAEMVDQVEDVASRPAYKASAEMLADGNKATAINRNSEFSPASVVWAKVVANADDTTTKGIKTYQDAQTFAKKSINSITKERDSLIKPYLKEAVDTDEYFKPLLEYIDKLKVSRHTSTLADTYEDVLRKELQDILGLTDDEILETGIKQAMSMTKDSGRTVDWLNARNKILNKEVSRISQSGGGMKQLEPEQLAKQQAFDKLRVGARREVLNKSTKKVANLNGDISGLIDAQRSLRTQRDRANKAISDIDWKSMNAIERIRFFTDKLPMIKDVTASGLMRIETASGLREEIIQQHIRRIRTHYSTSSNKNAILQEKKL